GRGLLFGAARQRTQRVQPGRHGEPAVLPPRSSLLRAPWAHRPVVELLGARGPQESRLRGCPGVLLRREPPVAVRADERPAGREQARLQVLLADEAPGLGGLAAE